MKQLFALLFVVSALALAAQSKAINGTMDNVMGNNTMNVINKMMNGSAGGLPGTPPKIGGISFNKEGVKMKDIKGLKASDLSTALKSMSQSEQDTVCLGVMNGGADEKTMANIKAAGVDCVGAMKRDPNFKPKGGQAQQMVKQMRESKAPSAWAKDDWSLVFKQMPGAVKASDIKQMSGNTLKELVKAGDLQSNPDAFKNPSAKRALESQLKTAYGNPSTWGNDSLREMGDLLPNMDAKSLKSIPPANLKAAASAFKDMKFDDPGKKAAFGDQLIDGLGKDSANTWSSDDVKNADQFIRSNPKIIGKLSDSAIKGSLADLGARSTDARGAAQLGKRLKSMSEFSDPTKVDSSKIGQMGHLLKGMGRDYLKKLPASAIQGALNDIKNISFGRSDARALLESVKGDPKSYNGDSIKNLGNLVTGLDIADFDNIPNSAIADSIEDIKDMDFDRSQCRAIMEKVKSSGTGNLKKIGKLMAKCGSPEDVDSASVEDLGLNCSSTDGPSFTPDRAMAKKLAKKIKAKYGNPSSSNTDYSLTCFQSWGKVAALGFDGSDFENLPDNGDLGSVFEQLSGFAEYMDENQVKGIAKRVRSFIDVDNDTAIAAIDSAVITQVGPFLSQFNISDLEKFNDSVKPDIASQLGSANLDKHRGSDISDKMDFALKYVLRDDTNAVTDRTNAATLDDNDIRSLGGLFRGAKKSHIDKMSGDAITANVGDMSEKIRGKAEQQAVWDRMESQDSTFKNSTDNIINSAGLVGGLSQTILDSMDKSVMGEALADTAAKLEERIEKDKERDEAGYSGEVSDTDKAAAVEAVKNFVQKAFTGYQESQSSSARKRRATVATTCSDVQTLGSNANTLTTTQLESLTTSEFTSCTETLGAITTWSSSQLTSLVAEAKAAYGSTVSSWNASDVKILGNINAGLTDAEISTLTISGADTLSVMGSSSLFSSTQMAAGFARFLSQVRSNTASSVTGNDLISLGSFACGATSANIGAFTSANFKTAASTIGTQTTCDSSQLTAYATLAKSAYGATSTWDSTTMTTVGSVLGGLTSSEIGALTTSQISNISPASMAQIPPASFAGFTSSQLAAFSTSQANSVTSTQQNALSTTQLTSLTGAGASVKTTNQNSAAGSVRASLFFIIPLLLSIFYM